MVQSKLLVLLLKALMTYRKKGLQPHSPGIFHWVLKKRRKKSGDGNRGENPMFFVLWSELWRE
jgi:hypothetical protein